MTQTEEKRKVTLSQNVHFTYKRDCDKNSLCQGDVLEITDELRNELRMLPSNFRYEDCKYCLVLSQSCDLVRRKGKSCKTPYISLAIIESFDDFMNKLLISGKYVEQVQNLLFMDEKQRDRIYQLLERIYNNNEPEYFFLYKDESLQFPESMIAYLRIAIAIDSNQFYEKCLCAKRLELSDEFKAKLGWLIGHLYSRVGTADWEGIMTQNEKRRMLNEELCQRCIIGNKKQIQGLKKKIEEMSIEEIDRDQAEVMLSNIKIDTPYEEAMRIIEEIIKNANGKLTLEEKEIIINTIKSKEKLRVLFAK